MRDIILGLLDDVNVRIVYGQRPLALKSFLTLMNIILCNADGLIMRGINWWCARAS